MRTWWLCLIALCCGAASAETVWRWVDEDGVIHYSDRPMPGAEPVELDSPQSFPGLRAPQPPRPQPRSGDGRDSRQSAAPYSSVEIVSPEEQETLWNIGATLDVDLRVQPSLRAGHSLDVVLDGERQNLNATSTSVTVPEVYRGVHTLQALVVDADGTEIQRSSSVTFMVQQTSVLNPNNPNAPGAN